jgi:hypothetical protein
MNATGLAIFGGRHLAQVIAIAMAVLIGFGILIWASWKDRRSPHDTE